MLSRLRNGDVETAVTDELRHDNDIEIRPLLSVTPHVGCRPRIISEVVRHSDDTEGSTTWR